MKRPPAMTITNRRLGAMLLSLAVVLSLFGRMLGQGEQRELTPTRVVVVDVSKPATQSSQYQFAGNEPQKRTYLEFRGSDQDWTFIWFDVVPKNVSLRTRVQPQAYRYSQPIEAARWYWFKERLPLVLEASRDARPPIVISYSFGSVSGPDNETIENLTPEDKRSYVETHASAFKQNLKLSLAFSWGPPGAAPILTTAAPSPGPAPSSEVNSSLPPETSWFAYLIDDGWLLGLSGLLGLFAVVLLMAYVLPGLVMRRLRRKPTGLLRKPPTSSSQRPATAPRELSGDDLDPYELLGGVPEFLGPATVPEPLVAGRGVGDKDVTPVLMQQPTAERGSQLVQPGNVFYPPSHTKNYSAEEFGLGTSRAGSLESPPSPAVADSSVGKAPAARPAWVDLLASPVSRSEFSSLREDLDKVKKDVLSLTMLVGGQAYENTAAEKLSLQAIAETKVRDREITKRVMVLENQVEQVIGQLEMAIRDQLKSVNDQQRVRNEEIGHLRADNLRLAAGLAQFRDELENLSHVNSQTADSDSFYAKTLGAILGQNVEALRAGNFEQISQQVGERLNQFFQLDVPHGDALLTLRQRAEAIEIALKEVLEVMAKLNPQAATEAAPHLQRAEGLAAELSSLQVQLQNRRATIETTLRVPVSIHAGARQTFLSELGRGVRREVDKLSDPQSHFAKELDRLVTSDVVSVIDVCDTVIAHPGTRAELETALGHLFTHAGLRVILPRQGDPFRAAEHEIVRAVASGAGKSNTVAQVMRRGFYHPQQSETLLRRAGVTVYR